MQKTGSSRNAMKTFLERVERDHLAAKTETVLKLSEVCTVFPLSLSQSMPDMQLLKLNDLRNQG